MTSTVLHAESRAAHGPRHTRREEMIADRIPLEQLPMSLGICLDCASYGDCPMPDALAPHRALQDELGMARYDDVDPALYDEHAIDEPVAAGPEMVWCPMYG